jgi:hypothetical protein
MIDNPSQPSRKARVLARQDNILVVAFDNVPDPPLPRFPGGNALRSEERRTDVVVVTKSLRTHFPNAAA